LQGLHSAKILFKVFAHPPRVGGALFQKAAFPFYKQFG